MYIGLTIIIFSMLYSFLLLIVYFSKKRLGNFENKIYTAIVIVNLISLLLELICCYTVPHKESMLMLNLLFNQAFIVFILTWVTLFSIYILYVSFDNDSKLAKKVKNNYQKLVTLYFLFYLVCLFIIIILPLDFYYDGAYVYSFGASTNALYYITGFYIILSSTCVLLNLKYVSFKKFLPMLTFIFCIIIVLIVRAINPGILLITATQAFITIIMYFTIENPDVKMLNEFIRNKEHADKVNNEKTMFLYRISQNLKHPVASIANSCDRILKDGKFDEFTKEEIIDITLNVKKMTESVNSVLNISDVETKDIKITNKQYKPQELFDQLIQKMKANLKDKEIELRVELDDSIPKQLMGDNIRLKQVINTVIENSLKYTEKGFIEFSVSPIIKHEICSLMITVEDSGCGINRDKLYHLFEDADKFDEGKQNLITAKKIVDLNGGTITIDSHEGRGTKVTLIVNQKLVETEQDKILRTVEKHPNNKSILLIENNKDEQDKFIKLLKKYDVNIDIVNMGQFGLEKIRQENHYDLILLAEEMPKLSGIQTFQKLKEIKNFNTPVILLIDEKHHELVKRYLAIGFEKVLIRPVKKDEIANLINELQN